MDLRRMRYLINRLPMARFRVERAMSKAAKCATVMTGMPRGGNTSSQVETGVEILETAQEAYDAIVHELAIMRDELAPLIAQIEDPDERTAAYLRYIKGYSVADISNGMCYCERHTFRILKSAEQHLQDVSACQSDVW